MLTCILQLVYLQMFSFFKGKLNCFQFKTVGEWSDPHNRLYFNDFKLNYRQSVTFKYHSVCSLCDWNAFLADANKCTNFMYTNASLLLSRTHRSHIINQFFICLHKWWLWQQWKQQLYTGNMLRQVYTLWYTSLHITWRGCLHSKYKNYFFICSIKGIMFWCQYVYTV